MGIKTTGPVYLADSGKEFDVQHMQSSHLLNVLAHHRKQVIELEEIAGGSVSGEFIARRLEGMNQTIRILQNELASRDPAEDDNYVKDGGFHHDRY